MPSFFLVPADDCCFFCNCDASVVVAVPPDVFFDDLFCGACVCVIDDKLSTCIH